MLYNRERSRVHESPRDFHYRKVHESRRECTGLGHSQSRLAPASLHGVRKSRVDYDTFLWCCVVLIQHLPWNLGSSRRDTVKAIHGINNTGQSQQKQTIHRTNQNSKQIFEARENDCFCSYWLTNWREIILANHKALQKPKQLQNPL